MKRFFKLFIISLFFSIHFYAQKELTISEAIKTTLENNLDIIVDVGDRVITKNGYTGVIRYKLYIYLFIYT